MIKLARTIRFDDSDLNIFDPPAQPDEWALSGAFEFSDWTEDALHGKARQAFANGWLGLESFGRSTFVAVAVIEPLEVETLEQALAAHFVARYGAPHTEAALPVAREEVRYMIGLCEPHEPNTLLVVERELESGGVRERFRAIKPREASLDAFAVHGD